MVRILYLFMWKFNKRKFIEAVLYFAKNTVPDRYGMIKAVKLLYFADLEHFRRYSRPIIGDQFARWPLGPVPIQSYGILDCIKTGAQEKTKIDEDLYNAINIKKRSIFNFTQFLIVPMREPDMNIFSNSDEEILKEVADKWNSATGEEIKNGSYKWTKENLGIDLEEMGIGEMISHFLILPPEEQKTAMAMEKEDYIFENFVSSPTTV